LNSRGVLRRSQPKKIVFRLHSRGVLKRSQPKKIVFVLNPSGVLLGLNPRSLVAPIRGRDDVKAPRKETSPIRDNLSYTTTPSVKNQP
jgi:hypothetical protein